MKAFVLAAGLGTRLRPWTLSHPKALVPVGGVPMLQRVIVKLREQGFDRITVNVHHFADQIVDFLNSRNWGVDINISDESSRLLDTGGGIVHAGRWLASDSEPFLIHNVDILSNADLAALVRCHTDSGALSTLLVSKRDSSRKLIFEEPPVMNTHGFPIRKLCGWHNLSTNEYRPAGFILRPDGAVAELAFSGIHVMSPAMIPLMEARYSTEPFPIMDFLLSEAHNGMISGVEEQSLELIDIGKPDTLSRAEALFAKES